MTISLELATPPASLRVNRSACLRLVLISDTHERHRKIEVPPCDVLIHAGDISIVGGVDSYKDFLSWFHSQTAQHKLFVAGNHDWKLRDFMANFQSFQDITYLHDTSITIGGVKFYGSPYTPVFGEWSYMIPRGKTLYEHWLQIPHDTDVLITHGPRKGVLDVPAQMGYSHSVEHCGDEDLGVVLDALKVKLHVFGHIHGGAGELKLNGVHYVNASVVNEAYEVVNKPVVVEI